MKSNSDNEINTMNDYWHNKWQTNDIKWDQKEPNHLLLAYFKNFNLKPGSTIFVPLSGKSIDMLWLAEQGYQVIGVELSLKACQLFFTEQNIPYQQHQEAKFELLKSDKITLISGDFFKLDKRILGKIAAVYDRAALIALPYETQTEYAQKMLQLIEPHTQMLLITFSYNPNEMQGPPFSVNEDAVQHLFGRNFNCGLLSNKAMDIPQHLQAKGLTRVNELAFHLSPF